MKKVAFVFFLLFASTIMSSVTWPQFYLLKKQTVSSPAELAWTDTANVKLSVDSTRASRIADSCRTCTGGSSDTAKFAAKADSSRASRISDTTKKAGWSKYADSSRVAKLSDSSKVLGSYARLTALHDTANVLRAHAAKTWADSASANSRNWIDSTGHVDSARASGTAMLSDSARAAWKADSARIAWFAYAATYADSSRVTHRSDLSAYADSSRAAKISDSAKKIPGSTIYRYLMTQATGSVSAGALYDSAGKLFSPESLVVGTQSSAATIGVNSRNSVITGYYMMDANKKRWGLARGALSDSFLLRAYTSSEAIIDTPLAFGVSAGDSGRITRPFKFSSGLRVLGGIAGTADSARAAGTAANASALGGISAAGYGTLAQDTSIARKVVSDSLTANTRAWTTLAAAKSSIHDTMLGERTFDSLVARNVAHDTATAIRTYVGSASTTGNAATATKLATARTISMTGDGTWSTSFDGSANVSGTLALAPLLTTGSAGSATTVPTLTWDTKGRLTAVGSAAISIPHTQISDWTGALAGYQPLNSNLTQLSGGTNGLVIASNVGAANYFSDVAAADAILRWGAPYTETVRLGVMSSSSGSNASSLWFSAASAGSNYNFSAPSFVEGGTALSSKYLGIDASIPHTRISDWGAYINQALLTTSSPTFGNASLGTWVNESFAWFGAAGQNNNTNGNSGFLQLRGAGYTYMCAPTGATANIQYEGENLITVGSSGVSMPNLAGLTVAGPITAKGGIKGNLTGHASLDIPLTGSSAITGALISPNSSDLGSSENTWLQAYLSYVYSNEVDIRDNPNNTSLRFMASNGYFYFGSNYGWPNVPTNLSGIRCGILDADYSINSRGTLTVSGSSTFSGAFKLPSQEYLTSKVLPVVAVGEVKIIYSTGNHIDKFSTNSTQSVTYRTSAGEIAHTVAGEVPLDLDLFGKAAFLVGISSTQAELIL